MFGHLAGLHDADDGSLDEDLAVFLDGLVRLFHLLFLLSFHGQVDVDAELFVAVLLEERDDRVLVVQVLLRGHAGGAGFTGFGGDEKLGFEDDAKDLES